MAALFIFVLGFFPIANWISGGWAVRDVGDTVSEWMTGALLVVGGGVLAAILSRSSPKMWRPGLLQPLVSFYERRPWLFLSAIAMLSLLLNVLVSIYAFDRKPLIVDEVSQLMQAQIYTSGRLWRPTPPNPEFFSMPVFVDVPPKAYSQFPPGGPAMLAVGELFGAGWFSPPLWGALAVVAWFFYLRAAEARPGVIAGATILFGLTPFAFFMAGSHMNHTPTLMWALVGAAALVHVMRSADPRPRLALLSGLGFGIAATIRPTDALGFAAPAGVWYLWRAVNDRRRWADAIAAGLGVAVPIAVMMWVNVQTTGAPLKFGYNVLWGPEHDPGFHMSPNGFPHTPTLGLEIISTYFWAMQKFLFHTPIPSLLTVVVALLLARRLDAPDRYLLAASAMVVVLYWTYWFDASYLGPRFFHPLVPFCVLWTARLPALMRERGVTGVPYRATMYGLMVAGLLAVAVNIPIQWGYYATHWVTERFDADATAARAGVRDAIVFVRESWGSQLVARSRALGVPRSKTGQLLRQIDACVLEEGVTALENSGMTGEAAVARLTPLLKDSAKVIRSPMSPLAAEFFVAGTTYSERCLARVRDDQRGFTQMMPALVARGSNVFARDLHSRDSLLVRQHPGKPMFLLAPSSPEPGAELRYYPMNADSAWRDWRGQ
jgi:hypothetical protein